MSAGALRDRVAFQTKTVVGDGGGGGTETWATQLTVWGQLKLQRGAEGVETGQFQGVNTGVLRIRYSAAAAAITESYTAVIDGDRYSIVSKPINPDRRNRYIEMAVSRGGAVG